MSKVTNLSRRKGLLYFRRKISGRDQYIRLPEPDAENFAQLYAEAAEEMRRRSPARKFLSAVNASNVQRWDKRAARLVVPEVLPHWAVLLAREAHKRAKRRSMAFTLDPASLAALVKRASGQCEVSGIRFDHERRGPGQWRPFAASIDRIDNDGGYTFANVRLVCVSVNAALNQWGDEVFWEMIYSASQRLGGNWPRSAGATKT